MVPAKCSIKWIENMRESTEMGKDDHIEMIYVTHVKVKCTTWAVNWSVAVYKMTCYDQYLSEPSLMKISVTYELPIVLNPLKMTIYHRSHSS